MSLDYSVPQQGERVEYDARAFILTSIERRAVLGGWWRAVSVDGGTLIQSNAPLCRAGITRGWVFASPDKVRWAE